METKRDSIILIGMPGAGKSTVGVLLAKQLGLGFVDTDVAIQVSEGKTLQQIVDGSGYLSLRAIEEAVLLETDVEHKVVATGGSVVYSEPAMRRLKKHGNIVFLDVPLTELRKRIRNYEQRGIARKPGQSLAALFAERRVLYERFADLTLPCAALSAEDVVELIQLNQS